jgi:hypothetical protein
MFGYTCTAEVEAAEGFMSIVDKIEIVKDEFGMSYLPEWSFNGIGNFEYSEGYQIKMIEEVTDFQFCTTIVGGASQEELDAAYTDGAASVTPEDGITQEDVDAAVAAVEANYAGWCASDIDNDGICDVDEVSGCMDASSCNYVSAAEFDDNSCDYVSCLDCAGLANGTSEDLGCGCGNPAAQAGYDCDGNIIIVPLQLGDLAEGGIVFYVDETGQHGLVAAMEDIEGSYLWGCYQNGISGADGTSIGTGYQNTLDIVSGCSETPTPASLALAYESEGYSDWCLPSKDEMNEMYNTIGDGGPAGNIGGFENTWYWSSSEFNSYCVWFLSHNSGYSDYAVYKIDSYSVRVIRAFGYTLGCMDSLACNYNSEANMSDGSCTYTDLDYDCEGNITEYIVGMEAEGGIVFYVDESGEHGLVAAMEDLGLFE